jgi:hypothetical protein
MRRGLIMIVAAATFAAGCSNGSYPPQVVENFMSSCTAQPGATDAACSCAIERIQEEMTLDEFQAAEAEIQAGGSPPELIDIIEECRTA